MKKPLAIALALVMCVFALTSCEQYARQIVAERAPLPTAIPRDENGFAIGLNEVDASEEVSDSDAVLIRSGTIDGNTFTNTWLGYTFTLPDGFVIQNPSELRALVGDSPKIITNDGTHSVEYNTADFQIFYDFSVMSDDGVSVLSAFHSGTDEAPGATLTAEAYTTATKHSELSLFPHFTLDEETTATIAGTDYTVLRYSYTDGGVTECTIYYLAVKDGIGISLIASYAATSQATLDAFLTTLEAI